MYILAHEQGIITAKVLRMYLLVTGLATRKPVPTSSISQILMLEVIPP